MLTSQLKAGGARLKKKLLHPSRERVLVREALRKLKVRYWETVQVWNPNYTGMRRRVEGGPQWLDFLLRLPDGRLGVLMFKQTGLHTFEKRALEEKKAFLIQRAIPYLIISKGYSQDEYEIRIEFWMRKEVRNAKQSSRDNQTNPRHG